MPSRIIRDSAKTSRTIDQLSFPAECFFWRLMITADDHGRFDADPRVLLADCFPLRVGVITLDEIGEWLSELEDSGLVVLYKVPGNDREYGYFSSWAKYQRAPRLASKYPDPPGENTVPSERTVHDELEAAISEAEVFCGHEIKEVERNVRVGSGYADLVLTTAEDEKILVELKRRNAGKGAIKQVKKYQERLGLLNRSVVVATGVANSATPKDFEREGIALVTYDADYNAEVTVQSEFIQSCGDGPFGVKSHLHLRNNKCERDLAAKSREGGKGYGVRGKGDGVEGKDSPPPEKRGGCPKQLKDDLAETWRRAEDDRDGPDWTRADWVQLERLWKRRPEEDEILRRWRHYLDDETHFAAGHSLRLFCGHFDKWKDPPASGGRRRKKLDPSRTAGTVYKPN